MDQMVPREDIAGSWVGTKKKQNHKIVSHTNKPARQPQCDFSGLWSFQWIYPNGRNTCALQISRRLVGAPEAVRQTVCWTKIQYCYVARTHRASITFGGLYERNWNSVTSVACCHGNLLYKWYANVSYRKRSLLLTLIVLYSVGSALV